MRLILAGLLVLLPAVSAVAEDDAATGLPAAIGNAIENGTIGMSFRYRYEFVDEDGFSEDAHANTLRSRLSFSPKLGKDWVFVMEFDDVQHIGSSSFNDSRNDRVDRPAVLDPEGTDLNQALVRYRGFDNFELALGRQRIWRGTQRFVGGVPWRQNEQTFDAVSASYGQTGPFQAFYAYATQVNRIFGPERGTPARTLDSDLHLFDLRYSLSDALRTTAYAYLMDFDDAAALSSRTLGLRADGKLPLVETMSFHYVGEYARQQDYGSNPVSYSADYYLLKLGLSLPGIDFAAAYEVLGGNQQPGASFRTPLATLHLFQGLADRFAVVSTDGSLTSGIADLYFSAAADLLKGRFTIVYHDFSAETGSASLGSEWDVSAAWWFGEHYSLLLQFASYCSDGTGADLNKAWLQLTASF